MASAAVRLPGIALVAAACLAAAASAAESPDRLEPIRRVVELDVGEEMTVTLADGNRANVKLLAVEAETDTVRGAVRLATARVRVNDETVTLACAAYRLPVRAGGVRIDCPITRPFYETSNKDRWGLGKDARLRLWPAKGPLVRPETFSCPVRIRFFASDTQMPNLPVYVDGAERPSRSCYYHSGLDFGGVEGKVPIYAATDGLVVSAADKTLDEHKKDSPVSPRYDVVYLLDPRGWYYRYSHMERILDGIRPGVQVKRGQQIGVLGKEGGSGGWTHLHFEAKTRQPSGKWGTEEAYAYTWEAYRRAHPDALVALARPHRLAAAGEDVTLDGSRSAAFGSEVTDWRWTFSDGTTAEGPTVKRTYTQPGTYSEILKVTDARGREAYDFCVVVVVDPPKGFPPGIHACCSPTWPVEPGEDVTFKVRTFRTKPTGETWDFGDGSPTVTVRSDANADMHAPDGYALTTHAYEKPGDYIATVTHTSPDGVVATGRVWVRVVEAKQQ
jgi:murein DD-endopeptidase MepM/ murein hydrolase activator NlpD